MRRVKVKVKLLLIAIGTMLACCAAVLVIHTYQVRKLTGLYLAQARKAIADDKPIEAIKLFERAIKIKPKDAGPHAELAACLESLGAHARADMEAQRAEQLGTSDPENPRRLARLTLKLRRFQQAEERIRELLANKSDDVSLEQDLAIALAGQREFDKAVAQYQQLLEREDAPDTARLQLATLYWKELDKSKDAWDIVAQWGDEPSPSANARTLRAEWILSVLATEASTLKEGNKNAELLPPMLEMARADVQAAREADPAAVKPLELECRLLLSDAKFDAAFEQLKLGINQHPDALVFYFLASSAGIASGKLQETEELLLQGVKRQPELPSMLMEAAHVQLLAGKLAAARVTLEQLRKLDAAQLPTRLIESRLLLAEGKVLAALELLTPNIDESKTPESFVTMRTQLLAECYGSLGQLDKQADMLRRVLDVNNEDAPSRERLAEVLWKLGKTNEAIKEYRILQARPSGKFNIINFASLLIEQASGEPEGSATSKEVSALLESAVITTEQRSLLEAKIAAAQGRIEDARKLLMTLPPNAKSMAERLVFEVQSGNWSAIDELLAECTQANFDSAEIRVVRVTMLLRSEPIDFEAVIKLSEGCEAWRPEEQYQLFKSIGLAIRSSQNHAVIAELAKRTLKLRATDLESWQVLLESNFSLGRADLLESTCQDLEAQLGRTAEWHYGQALSALRKDSNDATAEEMNVAQTQLAQAIALRPTWIAPLLLSGRLYDKAGRESEAIEKYTLAIDHGARDVKTISALLKLLTQKGQYPAADAVLRKVASTKGELAPSLRRPASEISLLQGDLERALELAKAAASASQSVADYTWLARLYESHGETEKANETLTSAREKHPEDVELTAAWAHFLAAHQRPEEARHALAELEKSEQPLSSRSRLMLADSYSILKMPSDVERTVKQVGWDQLTNVQEYEAYFRLAIASLAIDERIKLLEGLCAATEGGDGLANWARLKLAQELTNSRQATSLEEAEKLVRKNLSVNPNSQVDRVALAKILARSVGKQSPDKPLAIFEQLLGEGWQPNAEERFGIGLLYVQQNDWVKGKRQLLQSLATGDQANESLVRRYVELLNANQRSSESEPWIESLKRRGDKSKQTAVLLAKTRLLSEQYDKLVSALTGVVENDPATQAESQWFSECLTSQEKISLLTEFSSYLKSNQQLPLAEKFETAANALKTKLEAAGDSAGVIYVMQLLKRNETTRATLELDKFASKWNDKEILLFCDYACQAPLTAEASKAIADIFVKIGENPEATEAQLLTAARLCETTGQYDRAEAFYRCMLAKDERNVIGLNNLANLLALLDRELDEAKQLIDRALAINQVDSLLDTRGVCRLKKGEVTEATADFVQASKSGKDPLPYFHLALVSQMRNDRADMAKYRDLAVSHGLTRNALHPLEQPLWDKLLTSLNH